jgi:RNA polymerase subunit RPABC4/transcription elongation factor Spt4
MELDDNETVVHSDQVNAQSPSSKVTELDLYDELTAFAELSPEEQAHLIERREVTSANASITSAAHSEQATDQQPDQIHAPSGPVERETRSDTETPSTAEAEQDTSSKEPATDLTFEPFRTEQAAVEVDTSSTQEEEDPLLGQPSSYQAIETAQPEPHSVEQPAEDTSTYLAIEASQTEPHTVKETTEDTSPHPAFETAQAEFHSVEEAIEDHSTDLAIEAHPEPDFVEERTEEPSGYPALMATQSETPSDEEPHSSETGVHTKAPVESVTADGYESVPNSKGPDAPGAQDRVGPPEVVGPRPSGPLSGFNLPANIVYTGSLSRGVCLACGAAESGEDDLFCPACGAFMDELGLTAVVDSTCAECKQVIAADEIFCPWCGSALPA